MNGVDLTRVEAVEKSVVKGRRERPSGMPYYEDLIRVWDSTVRKHLVVVVVDEKKVRN